MMSKLLSDATIVSDSEFTHVQAVKSAAVTRQQAEATAATQKDLNTAAINYYRAVLNSARSNGVNWNYSLAYEALRGLTGGV